MTRWRVRFLAIICLIGLLLSVAISSKTFVEAYNNTCISSNAFPTVTGTPIVPNVDQPSVVLNEVLPSPHSGWNCAYQGAPGSPQNAWIELYNLLDQPLDLYGARTCIDTGPNTSQYCLSLGSVIPAHRFFTFFPYPAKNQSFPSSFSTLRLLLASTPVDQVNVPSLPNDVSYARIPDGTGKWQPDTNPTINASNALLASPSPTQLHQKQGSRSKVATHAQRKYARDTKQGNADTTLEITTSTASNENPHIQNDIGKQAQWHNLQFPSSLASPSTLNATDNVRSIPSSPVMPTENIPQNILFSFIGIAGLLSLWWGWKHFSKKKM